MALLSFRGVQVGVAVVGVTAATGAGIYMAIKEQEKKKLKEEEIQKSESYAKSRKEWEALAGDVVVLHHSIGSDMSVTLSPFDLKVN